MKRAIYVDYENVNISGLKGIESLTHDDVVKIFIGAQTTKLTMVDADRIFNCEASVELISNKYIGRNALDFIIMVHMGYDIAQELAKNYYIISKDKGYDPAIHEMRKMSGLTVKRVEDITAVLEQNTGFTGRIKQVLGIGKVKETPDTTEHTVVGKGKKGSDDISRIKKDYVSEEKNEKQKSKKAENKPENVKKSRKAEKDNVKAEKSSKKAAKESKESQDNIAQESKQKTKKKGKSTEDSKTTKNETQVNEVAAVTAGELKRSETALSENVPVENFKGAKRNYYRDQYYSSGKKNNYHRKSYDDKNTYSKKPENEGLLNGLSGETKVIQIAAVEDTPVNPVAVEALAKSADPTKSYIKEVKIETPEGPMGANIPLITTAPRTRYNSKDNSSFHNRKNNHYSGNGNRYNGRSSGYNGRNNRYNGRNHQPVNEFQSAELGTYFDDAIAQQYVSSNEVNGGGFETVNKFEYVKPELSSSEMQERDRQRDEAFALLAELDEQEGK